MIKSFLFLIFFNLFVFANVSITSPKSFTDGDAIYFSIEAIGEDIVFPKIEKIESYLVEKAGESNSYSNINGTITSKKLRRFRFFANQTVKIPPFKILIDNEEYYTEQKTVTKEKPQKTKNEYLDLEISLSNDKLFVGEQTILTMRFKYKQGLKIANTSMYKPDFENFWYERLDAKQPFEKDGFIVQELKYLLFPQKSGQLKINPLRIDASIVDVASNDFFSFQRATKTIKLYSNELSLDIKSLPKGISLIGDFKLKVNVDKRKINVGESISFKIDIQGQGNIEDIEDIKLDIDNTTIYENKPIITGELKDEKYLGSYSKSFSLLPTQSITIPSISILYFDKKLNKVITKSSEKIKIEVIGKVQTIPKLQKDTSVLQKKEVIVTSSLYDNVLYFILGCVVTLLIIGLFYYVINKSDSKEETPLVKKVKKASSQDELLKLLLALINKDENLDKLIYQLEKNNNLDLKIIKKELVILLKDFK